MFINKRYTQSVPTTKAPLIGVNLGGWLVLEKWMTPSLFAGIDAVDEYTLCQSANPVVAERLRRHRDTFITKDDFVWLHNNGVEAVRLPIGYWAFGDAEPFQSTIEYVDRAFAWAEETGIFILLDLHGAPGSQNGWDHSGQAGACAWADDENNIIKTIEVVNQLAKRYARHPQLLGFELLNEPKKTVPKQALLSYYTAVYKLLRDVCGPNIWIVMHDNFRPGRWNQQLRGDNYSNVVIDTHQYQTFDPRDKKLNIAGHLKKTTVDVPAALAKMASFHPVIVAEWSLALDRQSLQNLDDQQLEVATRAYAAAQLLAYHQTTAWFYWSYKTEKGGVWDFRDCLARGWLPSFKA